MKHPQYVIDKSEEDNPDNNDDVINDQRIKLSLEGNEIISDPAEESGEEEPVRKVNLQNVDEVLSGLGKFGKFQLKMFLVATLMTFVACWRIILDLFSVKYCPWRCTALGLGMNCTDSDEPGILPCAVPGNSLLDAAGDAEGRFWLYLNQTDSSIVSTYGLPCSETWKFSMTSSIFFCGAFFGVWMIGLLSDMIGRRRANMISLLMVIVPAWTMPFIPQIAEWINIPWLSNINLYLACRCLEGAAFGGYFMTIFVLTMEYTAPALRSRVGSALHLLGSVAFCSAPIVGYFIQRLDYFLIASAVLPLLTIFIVFFFVPDSPRWLLMRGRNQEAMELLRNVADLNQCSFPKNLQLFEELSPNSSVKDVIKNWPLLRSTLINMSGWFMTSLVYYMLWFGAKYLSGNIYLNALILGLAEIPGRAAAFFLMEKVGRKGTFMGALFLASIVMLISIYEDTTVRKVMFCIGKSLAGLLWAVIYIYTTEIYPTNVRGLGAGIGSAAARVAALLAPFIGQVRQLGNFVPYLIIAVLAFLCLSVFWMLPETRGRNLPQTLEEFEGLFSKRNYEEISEDKDGGSEKDRELTLV